MDRLTINQRTEIVKFYYASQSSVKETIIKFRKTYGRKNVPTRATVYRILRHFEEKGTVADSPKPGPSSFVTTSKNIEAVRVSVAKSPGTSIRRRSQELQISPNALWRILHKELHLFPYKVQLTQQLLPQDHLCRQEYAEKMLQLVNANHDFHEKILMSDEAHFHLNGYVNKQNCRFWSEDNPQIIHQSPLHPEKVTVWSAICSTGIIGPYFFEDENDETVTVTGERYRHMIQNFLIPELDSLGLVDMWFQQDGATSHTANATMKLLNNLFPGKVISKNGDVSYPPRSPDLTAPDFFLWGYLKTVFMLTNRKHSSNSNKIFERKLMQYRPTYAGVL